ncbi:MAG: hypothetical protein ACKOC6_05880, partial [bacterium]
MKLRLVLVAAVALALSATAALAVNTNPFGGGARPGVSPAVTPQRTCGAPEPTLQELDQVGAALRRYVSENAVAATGNIKVAFHVIYDPTTNEGNVPQSMLDPQIAKLNSDYSGTGFTYTLASVDRTGNRTYFGMTPNTDSKPKNALAIDPSRRFNIYSAKPGQGLLGWAT